MSTNHIKLSLNQSCAYKKPLRAIVTSQQRKATACFFLQDKTVKKSLPDQMLQQSIGVQTFSSRPKNMVGATWNKKVSEVTYDLLSPWQIGERICSIILPSLFRNIRIVKSISPRQFFFEVACGQQ